MYFKPFLLGKRRSLQDGGLFQNNPFTVITRELQPSDSQSSPIDFILSVGTGSFLEQTATQNGTVRYPWGIFFQIITALYPWRLFQVLMTQLDGQTYWDQNSSRAGLETRGRTYRINPSLQGPEIALNDASKLYHLQMATERQLCEDKVLATIIRDLITSMICSSFYMEVDRAEFNDKFGCHVCRCIILLRWQDNKVVCDEFRRQLRKAFFHFPQGKCPVTIPCTVEFSVTTCTENFQITLNLESGEKGAISGTPVSISSLRRLQGGFPQHSNKRPFED